MIGFLSLLLLLWIQFGPICEVSLSLLLRPAEAKGRPNGTFNFKGVQDCHAAAANTVLRANKGSRRKFGS